MGYLVPATLKEADALGFAARRCAIRHRSSIVGAIYGVDAPHREGTILCCGRHLPEIVRLAAMHLPHGAAVTVRSSEFARWKAAPDA